jgi:hypothetical protein
VPAGGGLSEQAIWPSPRHQDGCRYFIATTSIKAMISTSEKYIFGHLKSAAFGTLLCGEPISGALQALNKIGRVPTGFC